jgi:hypothetical protein
LRLLNPSGPDLSVLYNPFFTRDNYVFQVNMIFASFNLHDEFFSKHKLNYLGDIFPFLFYTGARYTSYDVIVMLLDEAVLHEQIQKAMRRIDQDAKVSAQQRLCFEMSGEVFDKELILFVSLNANKNHETGPFTRQNASAQTFN